MAKKTEGKRVLLSKHSASAYLYLDKPIYLNPNGTVQCEDIIYKQRRGNDYKRHYEWITEYIGRKKDEYDITDFRDKYLTVHILDYMEGFDKDSLSIDELRDIVGNQNSIAKIREDMIYRIGHLGRFRWWREYKKLLESEKYKEAQAMKEELNQKELEVIKINNPR